MKCKDEKCSLSCVLTIIGAIVAVAGIAALVVQFFLKKDKDKYCDCYHCECDDSEDDDFVDEADDEATEDESKEN
jgi:hypothetical protein